MRKIIGVLLSTMFIPSTLALAGSAPFPLKFSIPTDAWLYHADWLVNPALHPVNSNSGGVFGVVEPNHGGKWSQSVEPIDPNKTPYLIVRYAASTTLAITAPDGDPYTLWAFDWQHDYGGKNILSAPQLIRDGKWHTVAIDLRTFGLGTVSELALQVQATDAPAFVTIDYVDIAGVAPADAMLVVKR